MALRPWIRSAASPRSGKFRRDWIAVELTEENATQKGLIYRSAEDEIVYTVIDRVLVGDLTALPKDLAAVPVAYWSVRRHSVVDGRFEFSGKDDFPTLADAISVASAEHEASIQTFGPVPEEEWPEDREAHWSISFRYPARRRKRADPGAVRKRSGAVREFTISRYPPGGVQFIRSGEAVALVQGRSIGLWNVATGAKRRVATVPDDVGPAGAWALSSDGERFLWSAKDGDVRLIDFSGKLLRLALPPDAERYLSSESPGLGSFIGVIHGDGSYEDYSQRLAAYRTACDVTFSPDGAFAAAAYGQAYALVWDLRTGALRRVLGEESRSERPTRIFRVAWAPDAATVMTRDDSGRIQLWDCATGQETLCLRMRREPLGGGVDRPSDMPAESCFAGGTGAISFTPDSEFVVAGDAEVVRVWSIRTGREGHPWVGHGATHPILGPYDGAPRISAIRFSAHGRRAMTVGVDSAIRVWDVPSGEEVWSSIPDPCCVDWADIAPDGRHVIWAGCPGMRLYAVG